MAKIFIFIYIIYTFLDANVFAQLRLDTSYSPELIVNQILLDKGQDFKITNIIYEGSKRSLGVFSCDMKYNSFMKKGVIISTGDVLDAKGPNNSTNKSSKTNNRRDYDLEGLSNGKSYDAVSLEFDFIAVGDSINFNFVFASEEYPEYVNKNVNDVFGFFITDKVTLEKTNLAVLPIVNVPITVDNINAKKNKDHFIGNNLWSSRTMTQWGLQKQMAEYALTFEFDGLTRSIKVSTPTVKSRMYHFKMSIADIGDRLFDSAIFIEANSFKSSSEEKQNPLIVVQTAFDLTEENFDSISINANIRFDADSSLIKGKESIEILNKIFLLMETNPDLKLQVNGHTDESGTTEHNLKLSEDRAFNVVAYFQNKGIVPERLNHKGFGATRPLDKNNKDTNRRVEFVFRLE